MNYCQGDIVMTPLGRGKVQYIRMAPPTYSEPQAISVYVFDVGLSRSTPYNGTIFSAAEIKSL
jgi:hypothetical protein